MRGAVVRFEGTSEISGVFRSRSKHSMLVGVESAPPIRLAYGATDIVIS